MENSPTFQGWGVMGWQIFRPGRTMGNHAGFLLPLLDEVVTSAATPSSKR